MLDIFEIDRRLLDAFERAVDPDTGEILSEKALEEYDQLEQDFDKKCEQIALTQLMTALEADAIKEQKMKLAKRQSQAEKKAKSIADFLAKVMNGRKLKTPRVTVSYRKSETVVIDNTAKLPEEFLTYKNPEPNKVALKKAIKLGREIEGVTLEEHNNIQIK